MAAHSSIKQLMEDAEYYSPQLVVEDKQVYQAAQVSDCTSTLLSARHIALLPTELLCECFLLACEFDPHAGPHPINYMNTNAICLARVCRGWRGIMLNLPRAWSGIDIHLDANILSPRSAIGPEILARMKLYIKRSKSQPLSIRLSFEPTDGFPCSSPPSIRIPMRVNRIIYYYLHHLVTNADRWKHVVFDFMPYPGGASFLDIPFPVLPSTSTDLPMLETLHMDSIVESAFPDPTSFGSATGSARNLRRLKFTRTLDFAFIDGFQLHRARPIQTVVLDSFCLTSRFPQCSLVCAMEKLYKVHTIVVSDPVTGFGQRPRTHGHVHKIHAEALVLRFTYWRSPEVLWWLTTCDAPALRALTFEYNMPTPSFEDTLTNVLVISFHDTRLGAQLQSLSLKGVAMSARDVCHILVFLPVLESLVLHEPASCCHDVDMGAQDRPHMIDETLCKYFAKTARTVVPNLRVLELVWGCEMNVDVALAIVKDERSWIRRLRLGVHSKSICDQHFRHRVDEMNMDGRVCEVVEWPELNES
ncbi:hypothetical protein CYLTODRAFT_419616 [Cylindrobasidium torrendii FP15055 ss-10]|uniref:F-box domain-containing protein n=1 Tax=Cylindrobasidium torrendii FP15055 ss-10 TaxID=1314674 RepID=A0A0D7BM32_9AGAR|nr:hypothetical protein CYLTODRAFT_419616 [Cylindrobasidium torrendii FP15055 ss-10]